MDPGTLCLVDVCRASTYVSGPVALRYMTPAIDEELIAQLFSPKAAPRELDEIVMTDLLVASFRLSPTKTTNQLFPQCLAVDANVSLQNVAVSAMLRIARDGSFLPWTPTIQIVYTPLAALVRQLFLSLLDGFVAYDEGLASGDRKGKQAVESFLPRARVMLTLFRLFACDPLFVLHNPDPAMDFKDVKSTRDVRSLLLGLCDTMRHFELPELSKLARTALLRLHEPEVIRSWIPHAPLMAFWDVGLSVLGSLSDMLLNGREYNLATIQVIVSTIEQVLQSRNTCILGMQEREPPVQVLDHVCFCSAKVEAALLVALAATDSSLCSSAATSLGLCCDETDIVGSRAQVPTSIAENYAIYRKISSSASSLVGGRVHQQKQFHNVFFRLDQQTAGNVTAWEELWLRWNMLTNAVLADSQLSGALGQQGGSAGGGGSVNSGSGGGGGGGGAAGGGVVSGVAGVGGVGNSVGGGSGSGGANSSGSGSSAGSGLQGLLNPRVGSGSASSGLKDSGSLPLVSASDLSGLDSSAGLSGASGGEGGTGNAWTQTMGLLLSLSGILEDRPLPKRNLDNMYRPTSPLASQQLLSSSSSLLQYFFVQTMGLLVCDNVAVREGARSIISSAMSPLVIAPFLRLLHGTVRSWFDESGLTVRYDDANCALLVDQVVSVWKLFLDRKLLESDLASLSAVFEDLMLCLARFLTQVVVEKTMVSLQIRLKFCSLVESVCENSSILPWTDERRFREVLVDIVMEWTSFFALKDEVSNSSGLHSSSATIPALSVSASSSSPTSASSAQQSGVTTPGRGGGGLVTFYDGFGPQLSKLARDLDVALLSALATLLTDLVLEADNSTTRAEKFTKLFSFLTRVIRVSRNNSSLSPKLADVAIHALSELLSANTEAGLPYFVTMGYSKDIGLRTAFLSVLTTILKQGMELHSSKSPTSKYSELLELLFDDRMDLCLALCESVQIGDADELADVLTNVFEVNGQMQSLIKISIAVEVAKTSSPNTLFRRNSMATKVMTNFARFAGLQYLQDVVVPVIRTLLSSSGSRADFGMNVSFEIDESKLMPGESREANCTNLTRLAQQILNSLVKTTHLLPTAFRNVCGFLQKAVAARFPEHSLSAVGGFMFLRFVCPALVAPDSFGLVRSVPTESRRAFVLVAKVLQNLANFVPFGSKEEFSEWKLFCQFVFFF